MSSIEIMVLNFETLWTQFDLFFGISLLGNSRLPNQGGQGFNPQQPNNPLLSNHLQQSGMPQQQQTSLQQQQQQQQASLQQQQQTTLQQQQNVNLQQQQQNAMQQQPGMPQQQANLQQDQLLNQQATMPSVSNMVFQPDQAGNVMSQTIVQQNNPPLVAMNVRDSPGFIPGDLVLQICGRCCCFYIQERHIDKAPKCSMDGNMLSPQKCIPCPQ